MDNLSEGALAPDNQKGMVNNPYSITEYETMLEEGTWKGGFVENIGETPKVESEQNGLGSESVIYYVGSDGEILQFVETSLNPVIVVVGNYKCKCIAHFATRRDFGGGILSASVLVEVQGMENYVLIDEDNISRMYTTFGTNTAPSCHFTIRETSLTFEDEVVVSKAANPPKENDQNLRLHVRMSGNMEVCRNQENLDAGGVYAFYAEGSMEVF